MQRHVNECAHAAGVYILTESHTSDIISLTFDVVVPEEVKSLGVYATTFTSVAASFGSSSNATSSGINLMRTNESGDQEMLTTAGGSTFILDSAVPNSASCISIPA